MLSLLYFSMCVDLDFPLIIFPPVCDLIQFFFIPNDNNGLLGRSTQFLSLADTDIHYM